jgi:hypothetical protein
MKNQNNQMPEVLVISMPEDVQAKLDELVEQNYALEDMIAFIEDFGNDNFLEFYEEYVQNGEDYCYEAVDAFIAHFGIECLPHFTDAYYGQFDSEEQFAESFVSDCYPINLDDTPIVVDWTATWNCNLRYDFAFEDGYVFHMNF